MSSSVEVSPSSGERSPRLSAAEWESVEKAVDAGEYGDVREFLREAVLQHVGEILDEDAAEYDCPEDGCDRTFTTWRQLIGHLGGSDHAIDVPEGDFWCGYCGRGPFPWLGLNAHHGSAPGHDGDPIRLDDAPDEDDLVAPDEIPDHHNRALLERLYREHDGHITELCRSHDFDVGRSRVRHYLVEFGIHEVTPQGPVEDGDGPLWRDPDWLQERYDEADGNISEMHRNLDVEIPYRTLVKNLKNLGIHDPTDPPGKRHGKGGPKTTEDDEGRDNDDDQRSASENGSEATAADVDDVPDGERVYVLEWGRFGPPLGGTYHDDPNCWTLDRSDSDRDSAALPWPRSELEDDDDWSDCGHCGGASSDVTEDVDPGHQPSTDGTDQQTAQDHDLDPDQAAKPDPEPEPAPETETADEDCSSITAEQLADVEGFEDLPKPEWLDEGTFYVAVDMAADVDELVDALGWGSPDELALIADVLDLDVATPGGGSDD